MQLYFADDANLFMFISGNDISDVKSLVNSELYEIQNWWNVNQLSLNINSLKLSDANMYQ